jgi:hypothetical protein
LIVFLREVGQRIQEVIHLLQGQSTPAEMRSRGVYALDLKETIWVLCLSPARTAGD